MSFLKSVSDTYFVDSKYEECLLHALKISVGSVSSCSW